jgi:hypothetical protein
MNPSSMKLEIQIRELAIENAIFLNRFRRENGHSKEPATFKCTWNEACGILALKHEKPEDFYKDFQIEHKYHCGCLGWW